MRRALLMAATLLAAPAAARADTSTPSMAERITWVLRNTDIAPRAVADISEEEITWVVPFLVRRSPAGHAWGWFRSEGLAPQAAPQVDAQPAAPKPTTTASPAPPAPPSSPAKKVAGKTPSPKPAPVAAAAPAAPPAPAAAPVPPHLSSIEYYEVDCTARSVKLISAKYAAEHSLRGASQAIRGTDDFAVPAPGSSLERKMATICSPTLEAADPAIAELRDTLTKISKAGPAPKP